jgi:DNA-binding MarR family transcriptional regulator
MIDIDKTLMPWIGKSMKVIDYFIMDKFSESGIGLTKVQWLLLKRLKEMNGESQHNLAFLTNRNKASLTRLLTTMEKKNLVARIPSESDQRINHIYITKHGESILKQTMPIVKGMIGEMQYGITEEERMAAICVLKKMMKNIKSEELVALETELKTSKNNC